MASRMTAAEADRAGLVSRVVPAAELMQIATSIARDIASKSRIAVAKAKDCISRADEVALSEGVRYEQCASLPDANVCTTGTSALMQEWTSHQNSDSNDAVQAGVLVQLWPARPARRHESLH